MMAAVLSVLLAPGARLLTKRVPIRTSEVVMEASGDRYSPTLKLAVPVPVFCTELAIVTEFPGQAVVGPLTPVTVRSGPGMMVTWLPARALLVSLVSGAVSE